MKMNKFSFYVTLVVCVSLTACSRTMYQFETIPQEPKFQFAEGSNFTKEVDIKVNYESSEQDLSIFQVDVFNGSEDTLTITDQNIHLFIKNEFYTEGAKLYPLDKDFLIKDCEEQQKQIQKDKKRSTFWNIFIAGLDVASIAFSSGAASVNAIGFAAESTAYIFEDRSYYNALSGSIEEQKLYVEDWVLDEIKIPPGQKDAFDLLFEHVVSDGECSLEIGVEDNLLVFPYTLKTSVIKK